MNIYISHSGAYDYEKELCKPIKESELAEVHNFFLPHEPENIDVDAKDALKQVKDTEDFLTKPVALLR